MNKNNIDNKQSLCIGGRTKENCSCGIFTNCPYKMNKNNPVIALVFTKDERQHMKDKLESCFRGFINNQCYFEGEYALDLEKSILNKLQNGIKTDNKQSFQLTKKGSIMYLSLAKHMLDDKDQENDIMKAIVSSYKGRINVEWINGSSCVVDSWKDLKFEKCNCVDGDCEMELNNKKFCKRKQRIIEEIF